MHEDPEMIKAKMLQGETALIPNAIADMESMMSPEAVANANAELEAELERLR